MDSLTQIALGAAVGELVLGKKVGNRALAYGAAFGTLPDVDAVLGRFLDPVGELIIHRSYTHSFVFCIAAAPLLGMALHWLNRRFEVGWRLWAWFSFWILITHALLDCCTTFGTQLWLPLSNRPVSFRTIAVIDPLYTLPLLIAVALLPVWRQCEPRRRLLLGAGLGISSGYLLLCLCIKSFVCGVATDAMQAQEIRWQRYMVKPTIFNALLWRIVADTGDDYAVGYYSLLDDERQVPFYRIAKHHDQLLSYNGDTDRDVDVLARVMDGYYTVTTDGDGHIINDLRYGQFCDWPGAPTSSYVFSYRVCHDGGRVLVSRERSNRRLDSAQRHAFFERMWGHVVIPQ